jgi:hypothetical protein
MNSLVERLRNNPGFFAGGLGSIWLAVQAGQFFYGSRNAIVTPHFGIRYGLDSPRYVKATESLLASELPSGKASLYLGYDG